MRQNRAFNPKQAFTLLEMTIVIMVLLALMAVGFKVVKTSKNAEMGREAAETLRTVYTAQRLYLAENPATPVTSLTGTLLIPYLPTRATAMPTVKSLTGTNLGIKVTVFPPVIDNGSGGTYDPSGNSKDSLWDVGE
jgi:prepilin-type N-terminal cleavage/methylation domain-containing protein